MAPVYELAGQADAMLAAQKNDFYRDTFIADTTAVVRHVKGARFAAHNEPLVTAFADVLMGTIDNLCKVQTLGEEYCSLVQVSTFTSRLASFPERLTFVLAQNIAPILVQSNKISRAVFLHILYAFRKLRNRNKSEQSIHPDGDNAEEDTLYVKRIQHILATMVWPFVSRAHLMLFYFNGMYYRLAHRVAGIRHVVVVGDGSGAQRPMEAPNYRILGLMMAVQLILQGGGSLLEYVNRRRASERETLASTEAPRNSGVHASSQSTTALSGAPVDAAYSHRSTSASVDVSADDSDSNGTSSGRCALCLYSERCIVTANVVVVYLVRLYWLCILL
eukprot:m.844179 g.844179  ORF g.844179 m.844179 type:complete len:333 (-) comp23475_c0_seq14:133-1131(-)